MTQWSKLVHHLLFWPFYRISSMCPYHWARLTQSRESICPCQDPSEGSRHYQANLPAMCRAFSLKTLPRATRSLSRGQAAELAFCDSEWARGLNLHSANLCAAAVPTRAVTSWTQTDTRSKCVRTATCPFQPLPDSKRGRFSWASTYPT